MRRQRHVAPSLLERATLLTPHPQAHALYADKRNLALLSDAQWLKASNLPQATQDLLLASIPHTEVVTLANAERLWRERRRLFFKPCSGFGSRAAIVVTSSPNECGRKSWLAIMSPRP
ncbi:hypothetical protein QNM99_11590 [Pseudomonas sp. PCH446]